MVDWRLLIAAAKGETKLLDLTMFHHSDFDKVTPQNNNVLHVAAKHQRRDFAAGILDLCPSLLFKENNNGDTPLHVAASVGSFEVLELLVSSTNQETSDVENRGITKQLLRTTNKQNDTALNVALKNGHANVAKLLVEQDTGLLDMANNNNESPLYLAIERGLFDIADHILERSPLVSGKGPKGMNALHAAVESDIVTTGIIHCILEMPETSLHLLNESDVHGNTPLHLSVVYKRHAILLLLLNNKRVDKRVMNRDHFTAADLFYSQEQEVSFENAMGYYALQRYYRQPSQQQKNIETKKKQEKADLEESNARNNGAMYEVHLLVAVLVATVAFAAAFQLPGGYKPDGTPALMDKAAFKCFLVFDTIAFCFSVTTVYFLFYASRDGFRARSVFLYVSALLMVVSLIAMASAFVSGMYLISSKSRKLAIVPFLMVGFFVLHGFIYWFFDPRGSYFLGLERPREFFRKLVYRNPFFHVIVCN
ncbi:hypothetical protein EUTSA_v10020630mg [Eutrema salsugineum]|uniref:PGG domain-containing protein n=1 Tax=Eutrema salsugineum TaxID=72664 RepID=V4M404_EUTSA|nr:hypothetical protein EUTSA_v10020630mg [Eutrema salsugineum]